MMYINCYGQLVSGDYISHHGILGMHWGIRRFQPYPSGYKGDGKFLGRTDSEYTKAKAAKQEAKTEYKSKKAGYKIAKKDYRRAKNELDKAKSYKQELEDLYDDDDFERKDVTAKEKMQMKAMIRNADKSLTEASKTYDLAKAELKTQKALKKLASKNYKEAAAEAKKAEIGWRGGRAADRDMNNYEYRRYPGSYQGTSNNFEYIGYIKRHPELAAKSLLGKFVYNQNGQKVSKSYADGYNNRRKQIYAEFKAAGVPESQIKKIMKDTEPKFRVVDDKTSRRT